MRILVTGASGFIGSRLCSRLTAGAEVFAVTRGSRPPAGCQIVTADLGAPFSTAAWPRSVDAVVHLAQSLRHRDFPDGAADMTAVNVAATAALLEYARLAGASVFILASSGSVYSPAPHPLAEDAAIAPAGFYAASKAAAECLVRPYESMLRVCTLRLFYPYGPGQENRLIPSIIDRVRTGRAVTVAGSGDGPLLCPTYVDDIVGVIERAARDERFAGTFNVSAPWVLSLREVADVIGAALGRPAVFERAGGPEPPIMLPRLDRLAAIYPVGEFMPLDEGVRRLTQSQPLPT